jgi:hypothetical protein
MDLKLPIVIIDELSDTVIKSSGLLDMASGEIGHVRYEDHDLEADGFPAHDEEYEFTCGLLSNGRKEVEFSITVDVMAARYSVTPSELLEIKSRAAKLFTAAPESAVLEKPATKTRAGGRRSGR